MNEEPCTYCAHPKVHHHRGRCYTDVPAFGGGWRSCECDGWVQTEEV